MVGPGRGKTRKRSHGGSGLCWRCGEYARPGAVNGESRTNHGCQPLLRTSNPYQSHRNSAVTSHLAFNYKMKRLDHRFCDGLSCRFSRDRGGIAVSEPVVNIFPGAYGVKLARRINARSSQWQGLESEVWRNQCVQALWGMCSTRRRTSSNVEQVAAADGHKPGKFTSNHDAMTPRLG